MRVSQERLNDAINKSLKLLSKMDITEKVGQLSQFGTSIYNNQKSYYEDHYKEGKIGAYLTVNGADITNSVQKNVIENTPHSIPVLFGEDVIHGYRTTFPIPLAQSCSWNPDLAKLVAEISAKEAYCSGVKWVFSPMVDIALDPRWGRISEGYGEDPVLCSKFSAATVDGYEGKEIGEKYHVISCLKHFAAYGACIGGRDYNAADISLQTLYETYLPPFKAGVDAGCTTLMTGFHSLNGVPCTANSMLFKKILRDEWHFDGFVVSDCSAVDNLIPHGYAEDVVDASKKAFLSGVDMNMAGENYNDSLPTLVKNGKIKEEDIDASVLKILTIKHLLGLFDNPYVDSEEENCYFCAEHLEAAEKVAEECIVLLENRNKILPLKNNNSKIAVVGPLADDNMIVLGGWDCRSDKNRTVSILNGIKNWVGNNSEVKYAKGCSDTKETDNDEIMLSEAVNIMQDSDIIILALGELLGESGEAKSKSSLRLYDNQQKLWEEAYKTGKPVIVLVAAGRPLIFGELKDKADAIMYIWQLGTCTGTAVARTLFGEITPSGHLTTTFPHTEGQIPLNYNYTNTGHPPLGLYWYESKYLDAPIEPDYCFGYGLSYTDFSLSNLSLSSDKMKKDGKITIKCKVKNIGKYDGKAVIQLYIRDLVASCVRPVKQLKDFTKIMLRSNEEAEICFELSAKDLGFYDSELNYAIEAGKFDLFIGQNCYDKALTGSFSIIE